MRRVRTVRLGAILGLLIALANAAGVAAQAVSALAPDEQREFLQRARITSSRPIGKGVTGSLRLTLSDGTVTHDAAFQSIEIRATAEDVRRGRRRAGELLFADSYKYNIAAYGLARLLGLDDMMPVTVEREWNGRIGSLTWWVDDVLMDENERDKHNVQPPNPLAFTRERQRMFVFAELIRDTDRNKGNILYTKDWRVVMIDFTRAFRLEGELRTPNVLQLCERKLFAQLRSLTQTEAQRATGAYLTSHEFAAVMIRKQLIVDRVEQLIRERGESVVLYD